MEKVLNKNEVVISLPGIDINKKSLQKLTKVSTRNRIGSCKVLYASDDEKDIAGLEGSLYNIVNACFQNHWGLSLAPDVIWFVILEQIAGYIKKYPEKHRNYFTKSKEVEVIKVYDNNLSQDIYQKKDWNLVIPFFKEELAKKMGYERVNDFLPHFSTQNEENEIALIIAMMDCVSVYYRYEFETLCGIPVIRLQGIENDWRKILQALDKFNFLDGLSLYFSKIKRVINKFIAAYQGKLDMLFFQSIFKYNNESGGPYITGWFSDLFAFNNYGKSLKKEKDYIPWDTLSDEIAGMKEDEFPANISKVDFKWKTQARTCDMKFISGIYYAKVDGIFLTPILQYAVGYDKAKMLLQERIPDKEYEALKCIAEDAAIPLKELFKKNWVRLTDDSIHALRLPNYNKKSITSKIGSLKNLRMLDISGGVLSELPREIGKLSQLVILNLARNRLQCLPSEIGQLRKLRELNISDNVIESLPSEIGKLKKLEIFKPYKNKLQSIPKTIGELKKLQELNFSNNNLKTLPGELGNLIELKKLTFFQNRLRRLPKEIGQLENLEMLNLNNNNLETLPKEIGNLSNLMVLNLDHNQLSSIPIQIKNLSMLTIISVDNNNFEHLPKQVTNIPRLRLCNFSNNKLKMLPKEIKHFTKLEDLLLAHNQLESLPEELGDITSLQFLDISHNCLTSIPKQIEKCKLLENLILDNNKLTSKALEEFTNQSMN